MQTIVKAPSQADFLAMVPQLVGVEIHDSLVLIGFRGKRTHGAIRFDLPAVGISRDVMKKFATTMVGTFCKIPDLDGVVVVICTTETFGAKAGPPYAALGKMLTDRLDRSGFAIKDALCQAGDGWASFLERDIPRGGHPLSDIEGSPIFDGVPDDALRLVRARKGEARIPDASTPEQQKMLAALAEFRRAMDDAAAGGELDSRLDPTDDLPLFVESALSWSDAEIDQRGPLLVALITRPSFRDQFMLQWASDLFTGDLLFEWAKAGPPGTHPDLDEELGGLMMGQGPRPDPERIEGGIELLLKLVPLLAGADRLAPLCMMAWLHWALGHGSVAGVYLDEATAIDKSYGMVEVLAMMLQNGVLPEWAFHE
jgi:hypothetical protein